MGDARGSPRGPTVVDEEAFELLAVLDDDAVEEFTADGADPAFGVRLVNSGVCEACRSELASVVARRHWSLTRSPPPLADERVPDLDVFRPEVVAARDLADEYGFTDVDGSLPAGPLHDRSV